MRLVRQAHLVGLWRSHRQRTAERADGRALQLQASVSSGAGVVVQSRSHGRGGRRAQQGQAGTIVIVGVGVDVGHSSARGLRCGCDGGGAATRVRSRCLTTARLSRRPLPVPIRSGVQPGGCGEGWREKATPRTVVHSHLGVSVTRDPCSSMLHSRVQPNVVPGALCLQTVCTS